MSKSTFKILFYVKKNYLNKQGKARIMIRVTLSGDISQFSSKLEIEPHLWDTKGGKAKGNSFESKKLNTLLDSIRTSITNHYHEIENRDSLVTAEKIRNSFLGFETRQETILELFRKHNEDVEKLVGISKSSATLQKYKRTYRHIEEFMCYKYKIKDIALKEITHMFITDLENYLRTVCKCNANTAAKFIQTFRRIVIIAKNEGLITHDPFSNYVIRLKRVDRGYLTEHELEIIMNKEFVSQRLVNVRDIFVFACFTGLAYIDVKGLTTNNIQTGFDNNLWIITKRQKTDTRVTVPLLKIPLQIIDKYKGSTDNTLLPVLSNQKMNSYLKEIGDVCGINKNLTFHLARHTFATTTTLAKGVPIETVSKMLGHTNIKTTQIYARITDSKISNDMKALSGKLGELEKNANF